MNAPDTPNVTPIQQLVAAGAVALASILALVNAFEWADITSTKAAAITGVYAAFAGFLVIADAIIRNGRSRSYLNQPKGIVADGDSNVAGRKVGGA